MSHVKVAVRSDAGATALVAGLIPPFASAAGLSGTDARRLRAVVEALVGFTLDHAYPNDPWGEVEVTLEAGGGLTSIDVHDWGLPLTSAGGGLGPLPSHLASLAADVDDLRLINLGGDGKRVTAHLRTATTPHRRQTRCRPDTSASHTPLPPTSATPSRSARRADKTPRGSPGSCTRTTT